MNSQNFVRRIAIIAVAAAALSATAVSAAPDQYTLWADTNNDQVLDTVLDTDPGLTNPFFMQVPANVTIFEMKVHNAANNNFTPVLGTVYQPTGASCTYSAIYGLRCEKV